VKAILVNPKAGGGRAGAQWDRLSAQLPLSRSLPVFMPPSSEAMREAVRQLLSSGCQRLVVVGGDGTLHLVAGEILATGSSEVSLGLVPLGTGCDFARTLGLPKSPREAFTLALEGPAKPVDAGVIDGPGPRVFFVNVASAGISGMVDELVNANPRRGALAFLTATLQALRRYQPRQLAVQVDGQELFSGPALLVAVANGTSFGKGMHIAPLARANDGLPWWWWKPCGGCSWCGAYTWSTWAGICGFPRCGLSKAGRSSFRPKSHFPRLTWTESVCPPDPLGFRWCPVPSRWPTERP
jgi:diacylglycerol kinase (ATP)